MSGMRQLRDAPFYKFGRDDLLETGRLLESLGRSLYAAQVRWVGEVEDSGVAAELSCSSTRVLLRDVLRINTGDAADRVRAAKLTGQREPISGGEIPPLLPIVGAALDDGDIGQGHVAVITKAFSGWPRTVDQDTADQVEQLLVDQAHQIDPGQLNKVAQRLDPIMDPDGHAPDERDPASRTEFRLGTRNAHTGLTPFTGTFTDEGVEIFRQATFALAKPVLDDNGVKDPRSPANRLAQAHIEVLRAYLDQGSGSSVGGHVPHVTMTINFDTITRQLSDATLSHGWTDQHRHGPPDPVRRPNPARRPQRRLHHPGRRSQSAALPDPSAGCVGAAGRGLRLARLRPARRHDPSPPHHQLARRWTHLPEQRCPPLPVPPSTSPFDGMGNPDRTRQPTRIHPPTMDRPPPTTPTKPPPPAAAIGRCVDG